MGGMIPFGILTEAASASTVEKGPENCGLTSGILRAAISRQSNVAIGLEVILMPLVTLGALFLGFQLGVLLMVFLCVAADTKS